MKPIHKTAAHHVHQIVSCQSQGVPYPPNVMWFHARLFRSHLAWDVLQKIWNWHIIKSLNPVRGIIESQHNSSRCLKMEAKSAGSDWNAVSWWPLHMLRLVRVLVFRVLWVRSTYLVHFQMPDGDQVWKAARPWNRESCEEHGVRVCLLKIGARWEYQEAGRTDIEACTFWGTDNGHQFTKKVAQMYGDVDILLLPPAALLTLPFFPSLM